MFSMRLAWKWTNCVRSEGNWTCAREKMSENTSCDSFVCLASFPTSIGSAQINNKYERAPIGAASWCDSQCLLCFFCQLMWKPFAVSPSPPLSLSLHHLLLHLFMHCFPLFAANSQLASGCFFVAMANSFSVYLRDIAIRRNRINRRVSVLFAYDLCLFIDWRT